MPHCFKQKIFVGALYRFGEVGMIMAVCKWSVYSLKEKGWLEVKIYISEENLEL